MAGLWYIENDKEHMATILVHGLSGAKAWFDTYAYIERRRGRHYPVDQVIALAEMVAEGLKPYRVEGNMPSIDAPLKALAN